MVNRAADFLTVEYRKILAPFRPPEKKIQHRSFVLYQLALGISHLEGDTVECGVGNGKGSHLIRVATHQPHRRHHIFDSFEGLSEIQPEDRTGDDLQWKKGQMARSLAKVERNLSRFTPGFENIDFYKG